MSRVPIRPRHLAAVLVVGGVAMAPGCRAFSYYLSNSAFSVTATDGSVTWNQTADTTGPNGTWSQTITRPVVHISNVQGSNLTIVALEVTPTYISPQFGAQTTDFSSNVYPINVELSAGASGSANFDYTLPDIDSTFGVASNSTPISPSSTVSAPGLQFWAGQVGTPGIFEFEVVPLWQNAFNQTNFTGTLDGGNLQITKAAENNNVPSPRAVVTMNVQYNLAGATPGGVTSGGGGSSSGGGGSISGGVGGAP